MNILLIENQISWHLAELFFWLLGAFLIGLYFGRLIPKNSKIVKSSELKSEIGEILVEPNEIKIRATKTFDRGGKQYIQSVPNKYNNGLNFERIGTAIETEKDNLQKIKGIGKSIEQKLNGIGIFTFKQISNFNSKDITKVTELIKFFPGRIERDDWVGQAFNLLNQND